MPPKQTLLRSIGRLEAISFLILLFIAMPLKYGAGRPELVKWVGWAHGVLFISYLGFACAAWRHYRWPIIRPILLGLAALIPFGPFLLEKRLTQWESPP